MNSEPKLRSYSRSVLAAVVLLVVVSALARGQQPAPADRPAGSMHPNAPERVGDPAAELLQPEELVAMLRSGARPALLYVGPRFLYTQAHIPGAEFIGPKSDPESLSKLRQRAAALPRNSLVVLYCGCCPWEHCPNIRPAYQELRKSGILRIRVLYLAKSFGDDWAAKGYPVERGQ